MWLSVLQCDKQKNHRAVQVLKQQQHALKLQNIRHISLSAREISVQRMDGQVRKCGWAITRGGATIYETTRDRRANGEFEWRKQMGE